MQYTWHEIACFSKRRPISVELFHILPKKSPICRMSHQSVRLYMLGGYEKSRLKTESAFIIECCFCLHSLALKRRLSTLPLLRSTIDVVGLNFSVRNGKRWIPNAITTLISFILFIKTFDWTTTKSFFYVTSLISSLRL